MKIELLILIVLINIPLYFFSIFSGLQRPILNLDYVLVYIIFLLFEYNKWTKLLFLAFITILIVLEILLFVNQIFPFVKIGDLFYLSAFIFTGPVAYQKYLFSVVIYLIFIYFISSKYFFVRETKIKAKTLLAYLLFFSIGTFFNSDTIRSQTLFFIKNYQSDYNTVKGSNKLLIKNKYDSVSESLFDNAEHQSNSRKILLIVNESLGTATDPKIQKALLAPIYKYRHKYDSITEGSFGFIGATVSGELRELCRKTATVMDISKVDDSEFSNCLPSLLLQQGYNTYSVHGADGLLYDRYRWYPLVGFNHILFEEDFDELRNCKTFSGKCDYDLIEPIADIFTSNEKVMLYWLTLNTHTPYDDYLFIDGFDCQKFSIDTRSEACLNFKQQYQFFYRLSEYVQDSRMQGVEVYVVGDHAPPIMSLKDNFFVYKDFNVSWLKFKIK